MKITGAVLETIGAERPYAQSQPIRVGELALAAPGPGEVLVRIEAAGLCHSDLSVVDGNRPRPLPMLLGHESSGRIETIGPDVQGFEVGDRVVMTFLPRCGECANCLTDGKLPCIPGTAANTAGTLMNGDVHLEQNGHPVLHHLGVSGFATYAVVDQRSIVKVGLDIPPHIAAVLGCAVLTGGGAVINAADAQPGEDIIVVGLGGVGIAALITAVSLGRGRVIAVDALPAKLDKARELGADETYTPQQLADQGVTAPIVIEAAGHPKAFETAFWATAPGGRTITVGLPHADARSAVSPTVITGEARTIIGSCLGSSVPSRDIPTYAELWRQGRLPVEALISSRITLDQINEGMDHLADGEAIRQIIIFDEHPEIASR